MRALLTAARKRSLGGPGAESAPPQAKRAKNAK